VQKVGEMRTSKGDSSKLSASALPSKDKSLHARPTSLGTIRTTACIENILPAGLHGFARFEGRARTQPSKANAMPTEDKLGNVKIGCSFPDFLRVYVDSAEKLGGFK
jgi:hypothetical protein